MSDKPSTDVQSEDLMFDVRLLPYSIRRGRVTHDAVAEHLASLPDEADEAVKSEVRFTTPFADRKKAEDAAAADES